MQTMSGNLFRVNVFNAIFAAILLLLSSVQPLLAATLTIEITQGVEGALPVAIVPL